MTSLDTRVRIAAPSRGVWSLLTVAESYPFWNSDVSHIDGEVAVGKKITLHARSGQGRKVTYKVTTVVPETRMVWSRGIPFGIFRCERIFTLTPASPGVDFEMREVFTGLLAPLLAIAIPRLQPAFDEFGSCLKKAAEASAAVSSDAI